MLYEAKRGTGRIAHPLRATGLAPSVFYVGAHAMPQYPRDFHEGQATKWSVRRYAEVDRNGRSHPPVVVWFKNTMVHDRRLLVVTSVGAAVPVEEEDVPPEIADRLTVLVVHEIRRAGPP